MSGTFFKYKNVFGEPDTGAHSYRPSIAICSDDMICL